MQPTTSPITDRTVTITRKHARRPHRATHRPAPQRQYRTAQLTSRQSAGQTPRSHVLEAFRALAHGVTETAAEAQTRSFYRSSGQKWAHSLTEQGGNALTAHVVDAFREMAHGVQDTTAHAKTLHFYRSARQRWAKSLV